ncbi:MAG: VanZ family protein [Burkholderiales bacterium]
MSTGSARRYRFPRLWQVLGWIMVLAIVIGSLLPSKMLEPVLPDWNDKLIHIVAYGIVMFWFSMLDRALRRQALWALGFVAMGVAIEFAQRATGYRDFEIADMVADAIGVALGWVLAHTPAAGALEWVERRIRG